MYLPRLLVHVLSAGLMMAVLATAPAQSPKQPSPADVAADDFFKLRDAKGVPPSAERFNQVIASGKAFLVQYPTHGKAGSVIQSLATFDSTMPGKELAAMRKYWSSLLGFAAIGADSEGANEDARAALLALSAAAAGTEFRLTPSKPALEKYRELIDQLAKSPSAGRFLADQERAYLRIIAGQSAAQALPQAKKLLTHPDKKVAAMAQEELNLIELAITPLELKFTAVDGREFDVNAARGKVLYVYFWSLGNEASVKEVQELKTTYSEYRKKNLEIIAVAHDADSAAVAKFVKDKKIPFPVLCDGTQGKDFLSQKLNAKRLPAGTIFDSQGIYVSNTIRPNRLVGMIKSILKLQ